MISIALLLFIVLDPFGNLVTLIAGPGAISVVILLAQTNPVLNVAAAVVAAWLPTAVILAVSTWIFQFLGPRGATALERLMGILLVMLSVQMVLNGLSGYLKAE